MIAYLLPIPPSANNLWRWRGRYMSRSKNYESWLAIGWGEIHRQGRLLAPSPCAVRIVITGGKGWSANRDLDNIIKPTLDLLRHVGVIRQDDTKCVTAVAAVFRSAQPGNPASCRVEITEPEAA